MDRKNILLILLFAFPLLYNAQNLKQLTEFADQLSNEGNHFGASLYYKQALNIDSTDIHLLYKYAHSLKNYNNYNLSSFLSMKNLREFTILLKDSWKVF